MKSLLSLVAMGLAAPIGYVGLRAKRAGTSAGAMAGPLWLGTSAAVLAVPWTLPQVPALRFFFAVVCVLMFMRLTETWLGKVASSNSRSFRDYFWYFTFFGDIRHHSVSQRHLGRASGVKRIGRGCAKGVILLGLFAIATVIPGLWDVFVARNMWCLFAGYLAASGAADVASGVQMVISGHGCAETFVAPPLARSPGDFWGRRWNLVFRNAAHRVLFQRLARRFGVTTAGVGVFLWSIVAHEYLVLATLGHTHGHMTLFFGLQGATTLLLSRAARGGPWPTFVAVGAHWVWMIVTAPIFFAPILEIFPAHQWRLW